MWIFLATEMLFFGGMFLGIHDLPHVVSGRIWRSQPQARYRFSATINTAVLAVQQSDDGDGSSRCAAWTRRRLALFLVATMLLAASFLGIKFYEYYQKYEEHLMPGSYFQWQGPTPRTPSCSFSFYFIMTGMHALHMIIGLCIMGVLLILAWRGRFNSVYYAPVELSGLYWHFVDIVWVFLFPLLYLVERYS